MKPTIEIIRLDTRFHYGTFGALTVAKEVFCCTLEPPLWENEEYVSAIPTGQYVCERYMSPKHGETFLVKHVPNRTLIMFHAGNVKEDTEGCPILGETWDKLQGDRAVLNSGRTFKRFMKLMRGIDSFVLTIRECF